MIETYGERGVNEECVYVWCPAVASSTLMSIFSKHTRLCKVSDKNIWREGRQRRVYMCVCVCVEGAGCVNRIVKEGES